MELIVSVWLAVTALLSLVAADDSEAAGQFFNPPNAVDGTHDYSTNPIYVLGDKQTIKFTTVYQNYKIDLWQQQPHQDAATAGPTVFRKSNSIIHPFDYPLLIQAETTGGAVTQFDWLAQTYQFDLSYSSMFFFWLSSTSESEDGSTQQSVTSHYFNITRDDEVTPSPTSSSSTTTSSITTSSTSSSSTTTSTPAPGPAASTGLSAGAQAGIGVGAALAGLAAVLVAYILYRRSRGTASTQASSEPTPYSETKPSYPATQAYQGPQSHEMPAQGYYKPQQPPVEIGYHPDRAYAGNFAELPAGREGV